MENKKQNIFKNFLLVAIALYLLFLTYKAVSYNYKTNTRINSLNEEITLLESEQEYIEALNIYYNTTVYKELEARRKLGLKLPDETVVKVPVDQNRLSEIENRDIIQKTTTKENTQPNQENNARKWIRFVLRI